MEIRNKQEGKIKWTTRIAVVGLSVLVFALVGNFFREPLFGIKEGYAPHNFAFNFTFVLPSLLLSFTISFWVIYRTVNNWSILTNNKKWMFIGLSIPAIVMWFFMIFY